jgi:2-polyprenyl-3-methyl-5-hydroxy-6-metoxy-1,4-benzoquinol methylase
MQRLCQPEIMDQPDLDQQLHDQALAALGRINWFSRSAGILWPSLRALAHQLAPRPLRVLDLATGGGDLPLRIWRKARRAGVSVQLAGCDLSPVAIAHAQELARQHGAPIDYFVQDAFQDQPLPRYDAVMSSLFLHHQTSDDQARLLLRRMAGLADHLVLVNDLVRSPLHFHVARLVCRLLTRSPVVHADGPRSVQAAFTLEEVRQLANEAGLIGATVAWRWPFRFLLTWRRPRE